MSRVIGSELVQKYVGEGARMVRELFEMARTKKACLIFFDEIDAVGGARYAIIIQNSLTEVLKEVNNSLLDLMMVLEVITKSRGPCWS